jgi:tetratricopeptide (TPR) repeat protein
VSGPLRGYDAAEAARLVGLSLGQVRSWARAGFLAPERGERGELRFSFQDLVLLRAAKGLMAARVSGGRVRRALARLKQELPRGRALSELRITAIGEEIVVRDGGVAWTPESGQVVLDFDVSDLANRAAPLARRRAANARRIAQDLDAEQWFDLALELEVSAPEEARDAYRRALELDPLHLDARVNLGRLLQEAGLAEEALTHYRAVVEDHPAHATAWYNMALALEDLSRPREAVRAYERALEADSRLADAWYNLARLHVAAGKRAAALRALAKYRMLTPAR